MSRTLLNREFISFPSGWGRRIKFLTQDVMTDFFLKSLKKEITLYMVLTPVKMELGRRRNGELSRLLVILNQNFLIKIIILASFILVKFLSISMIRMHLFMNVNGYLRK